MPTSTSRAVDEALTQRAGPPPAPRGGVPWERTHGAERRNPQLLGAAGRPPPLGPSRVCSPSAARQCQRRNRVSRAFRRPAWQGRVWAGEPVGQGPCHLPLIPALGCDKLGADLTWGGRRPRWGGGGLEAEKYPGHRQGGGVSGRLPSLSLGDHQAFSAIRVREGNEARLHDSHIPRINSKGTGSKTQTWTTPRTERGRKSSGH